MGGWAVSISQEGGRSDGWAIHQTGNFRLGTGLLRLGQPLAVTGRTLGDLLQLPALQDSE